MPYGQSTDADNGSTTGNWLCCYICYCVDACFNAAFEEVVDCVRDTKMSAIEYFDEQAKKIATAAKVIRPVGILITIIGLFFLFMPVIKLLQWIPLVGWLLGGVVAFAAFVFALIVGTVISCLVIAIAWVFYRPLIGVLMLTLVGIGVYFIFFFDMDDGGSSTSSTSTLSDDTAATTDDTSASTTTADTTSNSNE